MAVEQPGGPGDGGRCPICREDMAAKVSEEMTIFCEIARCRGRYRHMADEHEILEDYAPPRPDRPPDRLSSAGRGSVP